MPLRVVKITAAIFEASLALTTAVYITINIITRETRQQLKRTSKKDSERFPRGSKEPKRKSRPCKQ